MKLCSSALGMSEYDLIGSPMMINGLVNRLTSADKRNHKTLDAEELASRALSRLSRLNSAHSICSNDSRGSSRTATTLLDQSLPAEEIEKYSIAIQRKRSAKKRQLDNKKQQEEPLEPEKVTKEDSTSVINRLSQYSGPLHNNNQNSEQMTSLADRLTSERIKQKSDFSWDQNGSCAKIRLGDGAVLQNLYPSHSHVKLPSGQIQRIDSYTSRMLNDADILHQVTQIKHYEYNQWARTKPPSFRDIDTNKLINRERIESKSVNPSYDTLRSLNPINSMTNKSRFWSSDDLAAKFSQPKFLKRMGYINEDDMDAYKPKEVIIDESDEIVTTTVNEDFSSDDEEYHDEGENGQTTQEGTNSGISNIQDTTVESKKQQLALYRETSIIGKKQTIPEQIIAKPLPMATIKISEGKSEQPETPTRSTSRKLPLVPKPSRELASFKMDIPAETSQNEKKYVRFSQPVCLCPKLSRETLNSFYSSTMPRYLLKSGNTNNSIMKCRLHSPKHIQQTRETIVLRSLN